VKKKIEKNLQFRSSIKKTGFLGPEAAKNALMLSLPFSPEKLCYPTDLQASFLPPATSTAGS